jgi:hypothetical protein
MINNFSIKILCNNTSAILLALEYSVSSVPCNKPGVRASYWVDQLDFCLPPNIIQKN